MICAHEPKHDLTTAVGIMTCLGALRWPCPSCGTIQTTTDVVRSCSACGWKATTASHRGT
jgi:predicted RNA-binding Zn-ribbon protein involved in translation (DUF1610 family)